MSNQFTVFVLPPECLRILESFLKENDIHYNTLPTIVKEMDDDQELEQAVLGLPYIDIDIMFREKKSFRAMKNSSEIDEKIKEMKDSKLVPDIELTSVFIHIDKAMKFIPNYGRKSPLNDKFKELRETDREKEEVYPCLDRYNHKVYINSNIHIF